MSIPFRSETLVVLLLSFSALASDGWTVKKVDDSWRWFEDYAWAYATYTIACEPGRECQVGMGIFAFGSPRGEKLRFTGEMEITVIGFGALHIRMVDGKGQGKAAFRLGTAKGFSITVPW